MAYTYKSPLQDEHYKSDREKKSSESSRRDSSRYGSGSSKPGPSRILPTSRHSQESSPYSRPTSSSQTPKYSSRYQLDSYPRELNDQMRALECKLCAVEMSSPIMAKMHYSGKPHMKKVKNFLYLWSMNTGNPLPDVEHQVSTSTSSVLADYCDLCDVRLLTTNDKMLHYTGKTHRKNERDPKNAKPKSKAYNTIDLSADARFGIGAGFSTPSSEVGEPAAVIEDTGLKGNFFVCEICDVKAVSQDQLNMHLSGKKHLEKVRKKEAGGTKPGRRYNCDVCMVSLETWYLWDLHLKGRPHTKAMNKLKEEREARTCKVCEISFGSKEHYEKHLNSESHKQKSLQNAYMDPGKQDQNGACPSISSLDDKSVNNLLKCIACKVKFATEKEHEEHMKSREHLLLMLDTESDKIIEDKIHWYCFTCKEQYHSAKKYTEHCFKHKHMTLSDENTLIKWRCEVCLDVMDQEAKEKHVRSEAHLMTVAKADITKMLTALATEELGTHKFHCTDCDKKFLNFIVFYEHMTSSRHLEKIVSEQLKKGFDTK